MLTRWYPTSEQPGHGTFVRDWARLAARTADATVLHLAPGGPGRLGWDRGFSGADVTVYRLPIAWRGARAPGSHLRDLRAAAGAIAQLHGEDPFDLIHAHTYTAATAARLGASNCGVPYVVTEHFSRLLGGNARWYHRLEARYALRGAAAVTAVGPALAIAVEQLTRRPATVMPNPVPDEFSVVAPPGDGPPFRMVSFGRLEHIKGFDVGLEALTKVVPRLDLTWMIAGDGSERETLQSHARNLGLAERVQFLGAVPRAEVHRLMGSSHIILVPSRLETFSVVAAEALMTGRPVVGTRCGGPEGFVGEEQGRLVDVEDPAALAEAIEDVLSGLDRFPAEQVASRARSAFSEDAVAAQLGRVYEHALTSHGQR
ncbi:MAG: glycosyltransferase [Dehalococcoidia bacterium]